MGLKRIIPEKIRFLLKKYLVKVPFYRKRNAYRLIRETSHKKRLLLLGTPEYGNLGDHAIALAELEFFKENFPEVECIEITQENLKWDKKAIYKHISDRDVLVYTGGGFIGSLYLHTGGGILRDVQRHFRNNSIIIMPSTVYYEHTEYGMICREQDYMLWSQCKNIYIFIRDMNSWRLNNFRENCFLNLGLTQDMALFLQRKIGGQRKGIKIILRKDKESAHKIDIEKVKKTICELGYVYQEISTRVAYDVLPENREREVLNKLKEFSDSELVITDRLHGLIFSIITGTPCIAIDNKSKKLSGVLESIGKTEYVCMSSEKNIVQDIKIMLERFGVQATQSYKLDKTSYDCLVKCIRRELQK